MHMLSRSTSSRTAALFALTAALYTATSCDNPAKPPEGAGDPENISRIIITLTPVGGGAAVTSTIVDPDGTTLPQPPQAPSATLTLAAGVTYNGTIELRNDIDPNNVINITTEVTKEANFHRFFYTITANAATPRDAIGLPTFDASRGITVSNLNTDTQTPTPQPFGTSFRVTVAGGAPTGATTLNVQLHHFESAKGDGLGTTFDTDLDVNFPASL
jgi:hypothetical protein